MNIFLGLFIISIGSFLVIKTETILNSIGPIDYFEEKFSGGSRLGYKLIGLIFVFFGVLIITGLITGFLEWLTSPLTKYQTE